MFTSGATECNNISVKGVMQFYKKKHMITTQTEHKCVLDSCRCLQQQGFDVTYLPVKTDGLINVNELRSAVRHDTGLVSVKAVNNEIGVIQPMEKIGEICKEFNIPFHTDAAQATSTNKSKCDGWTFYKVLVGYKTAPYSLKEFKFSSNCCNSVLKLPEAAVPTLAP
ncbi:hypothetical protein QVD17_06490 [Tagetes erecta]|uniref:Aminotransferase class V domain-containing protein n=1 Tax=Tagetes erecta TaxID=13708 RepID=A0AAD8LKA2_TARER|nr:hypothetical protein QVD17_06490 [Tagetes erecta]